MDWDKVLEQLETFNIPERALFKLLSFFEWIDERAPDDSIGRKFCDAIIAGKSQFIKSIQDIADIEDDDLFWGTARSLARETLELWPQ